MTFLTQETSGLYTLERGGGSLLLEAGAALATAFVDATGRIQTTTTLTQTATSTVGAS